MSALTTANVVGLSTAAVAALSSDQVAALTTAACGKLGSAQIGALSTAAIAGAERRPRWRRRSAR